MARSHKREKLSRSPKRLWRQIHRMSAQDRVGLSQMLWLRDNVTRFIGRAQVRRLREALARDIDLRVTYDVRRRTIRLWRLCPTRVILATAEDGG